MDASPLNAFFSLDHRISKCRLRTSTDLVLPLSSISLGSSAFCMDFANTLSLSPLGILQKIKPVIKDCCYTNCDHLWEAIRLQQIPVPHQHQSHSLCTKILQYPCHWSYCAHALYERGNVALKLWNLSPHKAGEWALLKLGQLYGPGFSAHARRPTHIQPWYHPTSRRDPRMQYCCPEYQDNGNFNP